MKRFDINTASGNAWISIADAITALFFVFVILFITTIFLKNKPEHDFNAYVKDIIEMVDKLGYTTYGQKIEFGDEGFFKSGSAALSPTARDTLNYLARSIKDKFLENDQLVMVVIGHTDDVPISKANNPKIEDNWDLSVQRAKQTRAYLVNTCAFPEARVLPAGFADQLPKSDNDSASGRAQNRRIELLLTHLSSIGK